MTTSSSTRAARDEGREAVATEFPGKCSKARYSRHESLHRSFAIAAHVSTATQREHQPLERVLGLSQSTAIVVGTIIGSGIFLVPQEMMRAVGHSSLVYLAWITGGLLSLFGAMTYAELAARMPEAGGEYVYLRRAYGDLPAFLYMWTWFAVAKPASIATVTIGLARTLALFPALKWLDHIAIAAPIPLAWSQLFAISMTWLMTGLNYIGIRRAANFQLVFTWLKVLLVLVIAITCFASAHGLAANFGTVFTGAEGGFAADASFMKTVRVVTSVEYYLEK